MRRTSAGLLIFGAWLVGCGGDGDEVADRGAGSASGGASGSLSSGTGGDLLSGSGGSASTASGSTPSGCKHADVVIAVDNSGSMSEEKQAMREVVFPAFADALLAVGGGLEDFRVGVLDACPAPAAYHTQGMAGQCSFASGHVWMESTDPDLADEFACVGDIWSGNSQCSGDSDDEQPASAAAASLESPAADGPNAGFSRDEALLVVVAITDEDEQPDGDAAAQEVHDRLVATKGKVENMVFLGIGGKSSCDGVYGSADHASKLEQITQLFAAQGRGVFWDLCAGQLEDGLTQAFAVIESACGEFTPAPK